MVMVNNVDEIRKLKFIPHDPKNAFEGLECAWNLWVFYHQLERAQENQNLPPDNRILEVMWNDIEISLGC